MTATTKILAAASYLVIMVIGAMAFAPTWAPACPTDDSTWCVWDARAQGNGTGNSFLSTWGDGPVFYLPQG